MCNINNITEIMAVQFGNNTAYMFELDLTNTFKAIHTNLIISSYIKSYAATVTHILSQCSMCQSDE